MKARGTKVRSGRGSARVRETLRQERRRIASKVRRLRAVADRFRRAAGDAAQRRVTDDAAQKRARDPQGLVYDFAVVALEGLKQAFGADGERRKKARVA